MSDQGVKLGPRVCAHVRSGERRVRFVSNVGAGRLLYWCGDHDEMRAAQRDEATSTAIFPADPSFRPDVALRAFDDLPERWSVGRHDDDDPWRLWSHQGRDAIGVARACKHVAAGATVLIVVSKDGSSIFACGDDDDVSFDPLPADRAAVIVRDPAFSGLASLPDRWSLMRGASEHPWIVKPRGFDDRQRSHDRFVSDPDGLDASERRCVRDVAEYGWHVFQVSRGVEDDGYSYTVGLFETYGHPEVVVFGQSADWQMAALRYVVDELRGGRRFAAGDADDAILPGFVCEMCGVDAYESYRDKLGFVLWYYVTYKKRLGGELVPVLQLVYPDRAGRYPDDAGYATRTRQPLLP